MQNQFTTFWRNLWEVPHILIKTRIPEIEDLYYLTSFIYGFFTQLVFSFYSTNIQHSQETPGECIYYNQFI